MPDSDISIIVPSEQFFSERVPDQSGTGGGLGFLSFTGSGGIFSDRFNSQINNRFFSILGQVPDFDA